MSEKDSLWAEQIMKTKNLDNCAYCKEPIIYKQPITYWKEHIYHAWCLIEKQNGRQLRLR